MKLDKCLCCESSLVPLIDFGDMPLVNTYSVLDKFPLAVNRCDTCCHLQLSESVDPEILYRDYSYRSDTGRTASDYFSMFARTALTYFPTAKTVMDIACNVGAQLDAFKKFGLTTYGIDPAENLAPISTEKGHAVSVGFLSEFPLDIQFDILTAQNVLAHTDDPLSFLKRCKTLMHDGSVLFVATSQANLIVNGEVDGIYHEHVSYYNAHSMTKLCERAGLVILDIIMHDIHGTSYVFVLGKSGYPSASVKDRLVWQYLIGMMAAPLYGWWKDHVQAKLARIKATLESYRKEGYGIIGCGAAAKGISLLNMAGEKVDFIFDNTPTKWNKVSSGMQILPFNKIALRPDDKVLFVLMAWNLSLEIKSNVLKLRDNPNDVFIELR